MSFPVPSRLVAIAVLTACSAAAQTPAAPSPAAEAAAAETKGMPPRASAADYQVRATAGSVTFGAEFTGHSMPTLQGPLTNDEYIAVEVGLFGDKTRISVTDFSLRVNGKKLMESVPWGAIASTMKDPEWIPEESAGGEKPGKGSKTAINSSGKEGRTDLNAPVVEPKVPVELRRAMTQRMRKVSMPEGDRALPVAGLLYFRYTGKVQGIRSAELLYEGPAGKVTIPLVQAKQ